MTKPEVMQDYEAIYLAPKCMASGEREWCEHDAPYDCDCDDGPHPWIKFVRSDIAEAADAIEALTAEVERLKLDLQAKDCLQDSAYQAGMKHGWNCAVSGDRDAYDTAISSEHIAELRRVNEARDACFAGCPECEPEGDAPEFFRMIDDLDDEGLFDEG